MSRTVKLITYRIAIIICVLCGGIIGHGIGSMGHQSELDDAYERGKTDGQLLVFEKWGRYSDETVEQLVDCIHLRAIYVFDSLGFHYDTMLLDTVGWYRWEISDDFARAWYDGVDSTHRMYEDALQAWAMSHLLKERKFIIYFDSTDTMPAVEGIPIILPDTGGG